MKKFFKNAFIGILVGLISGMFTSGGGLLLIPAFVHLYNLSEKNARATAIFCILPLVISTALIYQSHHFIDWKVGFMCALGGILGAYTGSKLLNILKPKYLKITFAIFLLYSGIRIIFFK